MTSSTPTVGRQITLPPDYRPAFTTEQRLLLSMLAAGRSRAEMADRTGRSRSAIHSLLTRIYRRLGAVNAPHAVAISIRDGLITVRPTPTRATPARPDHGAHQQ